MATRYTRLSKWLMISGGALMLAGLIITLSFGISNGSSVSASSAQATPARTATPAAPAGAATPVRTPTPAAVVATPARVASPTPARVASAVAPTGTGGLVGSDSVTFPALAVALIGAGLLGLGLFSRYFLGKSKA